MPETELLRMRLDGREHARQVLVECLAAEAVAEAALAAAEAAIWAARDAAIFEESDDDEAVEAFAEWLPIGKRQLAAAQTVCDRAHAETIRARAAVAHADGVVAVGERLAGISPA